jgi:hypothetical protein
MDGIVMIRGFSDYVKALPDLPTPFEQRKREPEVSPDIEIEINELDERLSVSAKTPDDLCAALSRFTRLAWKPQLSSEAGPITGSKFGGIPGNYEKRVKSDLP